LRSCISLSSFSPKAFSALLLCCWLVSWGFNNLSSFSCLNF
jgi:hypothetical protein